MWWCDGARLWKASTRASATRRVRWRGMARWYAYGSVYTDGEYKDVGRGRRSRGAASTGTLAAPSVRRLVEGRQDGRARRVPFCQGADLDGSTLRCCCCVFNTQRAWSARPGCVRSVSVTARFRTFGLLGPQDQTLTHSTLTLRPDPGTRCHGHRRCHGTWARSRSRGSGVTRVRPDPGSSRGSTRFPFRI